MLNKSLHDKYRTKVMEGSMYMFANFLVSPNVSMYKVSLHSFKLTFTPQTHIMLWPNAFPDYVHADWTLADIGALTKDILVNHLVGKVFHML